MLHVPAALVLGLLAGILDLIPVLGFLVFTGTAMLVAASVSAASALTVLMAYSAYHFVENYYLVPRVYGGQLRLSMVAVLLAFAVGGELGGVLGALIALPVAAAYPAVERIWLRDYLAADTVAEHVRIGERTGKVRVSDAGRGALVLHPTECRSYLVARSSVRKIVEPLRCTSSRAGGRPTSARRAGHPRCRRACHPPRR